MLHWGYDEHNGRGAAARSPPLGTGGLPSGRPRPSRGSAPLPEPSRAAPCESCRQLEVPPGLRSDGAGGIWGGSDAGSIPCERGGGAGLEARSWPRIPGAAGASSAGAAAGSCFCYRVFFGHTPLRVTPPVMSLSRPAVGSIGVGRLSA